MIQSFGGLELYIFDIGQWFLGDSSRSNTLAGFYYIFTASNLIVQNPLDLSP